MSRSMLLTQVFLILIVGLLSGAAVQAQSTPIEEITPDSCSARVDAVYDKAHNLMTGWRPEAAAAELEALRSDVVYDSMSYDCKVRILSLLIQCYEELQEAEKDAIIKQLITDILLLDLDFDFSGRFEDDAYVATAEEIRRAIILEGDQSSTAGGNSILDFSPVPDGVRVILDGEFLGETPLAPLEVEPGTHSILLKKRYFTSVGKDSPVEIHEGRWPVPSDGLVPKSRGIAIQRSALFPGLGQLYSEQNVKGAVFLGAEVATLAFLVYAVSDYNAKESGYYSAQREYSEAATSEDEERLWQSLQKSWSDLSGSSDRLNLSMILPLVVYVANLFDAAIYGGAPRWAIEEYKEHQNRIGTNAEAHGIYLTIGL